MKALPLTIQVLKAGGVLFKEGVNGIDHPVWQKEEKITLQLKNEIKIASILSLEYVETIVLIVREVSRRLTMPTSELDECDFRPLRLDLSLNYLTIAEYLS